MTGGNEGCLGTKRGPDHRETVALTREGVDGLNEQLDRNLERAWLLSRTAKPPYRQREYSVLAEELCTLRVEPTT
jgi:hypothetical protein